MKPKRPEIWFTSDLHFDHKPVLGFNNRPWPTIEEMNEGLIKNWNSVVKTADTVIVVGDVFFCGSQKAAGISSRLNGRKILVSGNHDGGTQKMMNSGFDFVCEKLVLKIAGQEVHVVHYPYSPPLWFTILKKLSFQKQTRYLDRRLKNEGKWLIHGHTHSTYKKRKNEIHVGVDANDYKPVHISSIESIITTGKLNGKNDDNRFEYSVFRIRFIRNWFKGITKLWCNKAGKKRLSQIELSSKTTPNYERFDDAD